MEFNHKILRKIRKSNGFSQNDVAKFLRNKGLKCERVTYSAWENGLNPISIKHLNCLKDLYGKDLSEFFTFNGNESVLRKGGEINMEFKDQLRLLENELNYYKGIIEGFRLAGHDVPPFGKRETFKNTSNGET